MARRPTRYVWDGLRRQRLDRPYIRENGKLRPASWGEALGAAAAAIKGATKLAASWATWPRPRRRLR
jgi:NADH-quinone oxidoreductase subunit G